jgi:hypothetical protein
MLYSKIVSQRAEKIKNLQDSKLLQGKQTGNVRGF